MYEVRCVPARQRVEIVFSGDYGHDQGAFEAEFGKAVAAAKGSDGQFDLLVDFTAVPVMDQQRAADGERMIAWCLANGLRKSANVTGEVLQKMQVRRLSAADEKFQYFETRADAARWLAE